jgi:hypothetical protein
MYSDKKYGSIIFKTVSGRSSYPHEENTLKVLDPRISVLSLPSPYFLPDDAIIFEVEVFNVGVDSEKFMLTTDNHSNDQGLGISYYDSPFQLSIGRLFDLYHGSESIRSILIDSNAQEMKDLIESFWGIEHVFVTKHFLSESTYGIAWIVQKLRFQRDLVIPP